MIGPQKSLSRVGEDNYIGPINPDDIMPEDERKSSVVVYSGEGLDKEVTLDDFTIHKVIGRGTFGKVFLIERKSKKGEVYAMKSIDKHDIIEQEQLEATILEKDIMQMCTHPFLVGMSYVYCYG